MGQTPAKSDALAPCCPPVVNLGTGLMSLAHADAPRFRVLGIGGSSMDALKLTSDHLCFGHQEPTALPFLEVLGDPGPNPGSFFGW